MLGLDCSPGSSPMSIPDSALKSLIDASRLPGEAPLRVPPGPEQARQLEALKSAIQPENPDAHLSKWSGAQALLVQVRIPVEGTYPSYRDSLSLQVTFAGDTLQVLVGYRGDGVPLSGANQLRRLCAAVRERLLAYWRREQKREKIRKLKERAIETQIEALAARMRFAYALRPMRSKVKLIVRLDRQNGLIVDIPHNRIEEIIAGLEPLIETVRALYGHGARFKVAGVDGRGFREPPPA